MFNYHTEFRICREPVGPAIPLQPSDILVYGSAHVYLRVPCQYS